MGNGGITDTGRTRRPWASRSSPSSGPSRFTGDMVTHPSSTHTKNILMVRSLFKTLQACARVNHFTSLSLGFLLFQMEMRSQNSPHWPWQQFLTTVIKVENTGHVTKDLKAAVPILFLSHLPPVTYGDFFDSPSSFYPHRKPRVQNCNLRNMGMFL